MNIRRGIGVLIGLAVAVSAFAQEERKPSKKKKKEDEEPITQTLPLLKDPPVAAVGETDRLAYHVSPLSAKGLLSPQIREALKVLFQENRGASMIKLRAFVAGSGDLRRVQTLVSEIFTEHKMSLPALSTVQVGALPMEGAQVVIESVAVEKKPVNPSGLAFISGQGNKDYRQSVAQLKTAMTAAKVSELLKVTCFLSSLDEIASIRSAVAGAFPGAAANFVQVLRLAVQPMTECEAVGRLEQAPSSPVEFLNPPGLSRSPNFTQVVLVKAPKVVFSGTQMAFGAQKADVQLAFERLGKALEPFDVNYKSVVWTSVYPLTTGVADTFRGIRFDFEDKDRPPASALLLFEGLPSLDASVAFELVGVPAK
jgi:enamine deaminase RidA (YjgF/YER057c/UK114 family)